jgi:hypothetical protein
MALTATALNTLVSYTINDIGMMKPADKSL